MIAVSHVLVQMEDQSDPCGERKWRNADMSLHFHPLRILPIPSLHPYYKYVSLNVAYLIEAQRSLILLIEAPSFKCIPCSPKLCFCGLLAHRSQPVCSLGSSLLYGVARIPLVFSYLCKLKTVLWWEQRQQFWNEHDSLLKATTKGYLALIPPGHLWAHIPS